MWWSQAFAFDTPVQSWEVPTTVPAGTLLRLIYTLMYRTEDTPAVRRDMLFRYAWSIGTAAAGTGTTGQDPPEVVMKRAMFIPVQAAATGISPAPLERLDLDLARTIAPGETLWFEADAGMGTVSWIWCLEFRALVLLP